MAAGGPRRPVGDCRLFSDDSPAAAQRLKDEIESKVSALPEHPSIYRRGRVAGTREMVVHGNYLVVYAENDGALTILRVLHGAQQWPSEED